MKELNGVKIIGIDHGYGNIKSSCTVTPTGLFKYETEPVFSGNILEYNKVPGDPTAIFDCVIGSGSYYGDFAVIKLFIR